jgi:type I restriction-modification system DNA methylase subunit
MINRQALLADLQKFLQRIEADLLERSESTEVPEVPAALHAEYEKAAKAERTAQNYEDWRTDTITQAAAAWVLSCVFVRFLEDNSLIDPPKIAGPGERLARARDEHELYFRSHPQHTDREYLLSIFADLAKLPGTKGVFGEHNAVNDLPNWLSGDAAGELLSFFQRLDGTTQEAILVHDFTDLNWDTRFLGDLYQDLSEAARKKFALLQTPDFVEEFILDRTLDPAIEEFGLVPQPIGNEKPTITRFKMIDPACGSGHFLLGAFPRLLDRWQRKEPGTNIRELTQRALDSIHGVDVNPFAVAIAKFRLLLAAMKACEELKLHKGLPPFQINIACGDSLLHGENRTSSGQNLMDFAEGATDQELYSHAYPGEDLQTVREFLKPNSYHCVVANPPYIVPRDRKLNDWYRNRFTACGGKYSLSVPFMQQVFGLATESGFTGQITSNSFMKREFGKRLIESFIPTIDLTHVIDSSGAYIPGHGTPTTILFGRKREPFGGHLRTVLGIRGEPSTPDNPAAGKVWSSIVNFVDCPGCGNEYVSCTDSARMLFNAHPWAIGGGGASELKQRIEDQTDSCLGHECDTMICLVTLEDEAYTAPQRTWMRAGIKQQELAGFVDGDMIRDWEIFGINSALFPHDWKTRKPKIGIAAERRLWILKSNLSRRLWFSKTQVERGLKWYEYGMVSGPAIATPFSIAYGEIATHNHFIFDRGGKVFNRTAPVIKLSSHASEDNHLELLGLLNCSTCCFWLKQVCHNKGSTVDQHGARQRTAPFEDFYAMNGTKLKQLPLPQGRPLESSKCLDHFAQNLAALEPSKIIHQSLDSRREETASQTYNVSTLLRGAILAAREEWESTRRQMIAVQENLDWECYRLYGLVDGVLTEQISKSSWLPIKLGQRAFEIVLARKIAAGDVQSTWFERHGSTPITELPADWPEDYKKLVERRIELIESDPNIRLIEQPEYKRRWNTEPWESQLERAVREWLLLRLETYFDFDGRMTEAAIASDRAVPLGEIAMYSVAHLADAARRDPQFMEVGELYRDDPAFDVQALVEELVLAESVPHLPILRYKDSGLRKRAEWEKTWDLQRREDAGESVGTIPVPPKYTSADFISTGGARYWALRGKLDVPKERWVSFPHCEGPDGTLVICWAGYDHLQQAQAISAYYVRVQTEFGGSDDPRLIPLLASLIELLPWLKQWHNEPNANFDGLRMGDYFEGFVNEEARNLGKTLSEIKAWVPPKKVASRRKLKATSSKAVDPSNSNEVNEAST